MTVDTLYFGLVFWLVFCFGVIVAGRGNDIKRDSPSPWEPGRGLGVGMVP